MRLKYYLIFGGFAAVLLVIDLLSKQFLMGESFSLISGVISILPVWNTGAGWSILSDQTLLLTIFTGLILAGIIVLNIFYKPNSKFYLFSMALIVAGALGNFIDRIIFGAVRDFIKLDFINFPIFNFADICLTVGAILLCVYFIFFYKSSEKRKNSL